MRKRYLILLLIWFTNHTNAQVNEIGLFFGGSNYSGDIGSTAFINPNSPAIGLVYKFNHNPRIAYRATFTSTLLRANDANSNNDVRKSFNNSFKKNLSEITAGIEFNFFEYNLASRSQTRTPYFILELAAFQYNAAKSEAPLGGVNYETKRNIAIPFGLGYKTRLFGKFAFAIETRIRYTFTDDIDDGLFKKNTSTTNAKFNNPLTNDWYMFTGASLVYTFGRPPCY